MIVVGLLELTRLVSGLGAEQLKSNPSSQEGNCNRKESKRPAEQYKGMLASRAGDAVLTGYARVGYS